MLIIEIILAFCLGVFIQRVYDARSKGNIHLPMGVSWKRSNNVIYRKLHAFYCELCPRRHYCKLYLNKKGKLYCRFCNKYVDRSEVIINDCHWCREERIKHMKCGSKVYRKI